MLDGTQRNEEKPVHQQETVVLPASEEGGRRRREEGGKGDGVWKTWGRKVNGIRQHARANLKCNHH